MRVLDKIYYNSPVILTVVILSLFTLLLDALTNGWSNQMLFSVYRFSLLDPLGYFRLFGHIIGHSGYEHLLGNMLFLLVIGPPMEEKYGSKTLLMSILCTALLSGILQCILFPSVALLGASGIVFMLIMLSSFSGIKSGQLPLTLILVAVLYLGQEIYDAIFLHDNVSQFMHVVGGLAGTFFGFSFTRKGKRK